MNRILILTFFIPIASLGGNDNYSAGGRQSGMANAGVTLSDLWSMSHNQAGIANLEKPVAGVSYDSRFLIKNLAQQSAAVAIPVKGIGVFGASVSYFGYKLYNEQKVGIAYAKTFGKTISFGMQLDYLGTHINDDTYGNRSAFAAEAGILVKLSNKLDLGAHIYNPSRARLSVYDDERSPTIMKAGFGYRFSTKVIMTAEAEKDVDAKNVFKAGLEYNVAKPVYLRAGVSSNPSMFSFGFGLKLDNLRFDLASQMHPVLGYSPQASLVYEFK